MIQFSKMPNELVLDTSLTANAIRTWHVIYTETLGRPDWNLSFSQIAKKIGASRRTVIDAIAALIERGWLKKRLSNKGAGHPHVYEALVQKLAPVEEEGGADPRTGVVQILAPATSADSRTHRESHLPGESLTGEKKQRAGARRGRNSVKSYGREPGDSQEMPEEGRSEKPKKKFTSVPPENSHARVMYEYTTGLANLRVRAPQRIMQRAVKNLREEGYSYPEITLLVKTFLSRHESEIRDKSREIDPAVLFQQVRYQLINQTSSQIADKRAGRMSSKERSERQGAELLARLKGEA